MIVVLTGAPGAGKGTQADLLVEKSGYRKISTGDCLRKHIKEKTPLGLKVEEVMRTGKLVSDEILFEVLKEEIGDDVNEKILLDGYPRNINQAKTLDGFGVQKVLKAIHLDVESNELVRRLSGRRVCGSCGSSFHVDFSPPSNEGLCDRCGAELTQRSDDNADKVSVRLKVYEDETKPVLDFYKDKGLYEVVLGIGPTSEVFDRLQQVIAGL